MSDLTVTWRGIRSRSGRSVLVLLLSTVAIAAAVLAPLFATAAAQSVLTDEVADAPAALNGLAARAIVGNGGSTGAGVRAAVQSRLRDMPKLAAALAPPVVTVLTGVQPRTTVPSLGLLLYRDGACAHLGFDSGSCPTGPDQIAMSTRTAKTLGLRVGGKLTLGVENVRGSFAGPLPPNPSYDVVGIYRVPAVDDQFWATDGFFSGGDNNELDDGTKVLDPLVTGAEAGVTAVPTATVQGRAQFPIVAQNVRLSDVDSIRANIEDLRSERLANNVTVEAGLGAALRDAATERSAISTGVPVVALPLVVLCWFVLFLVVAAVTDDRRAEIAVGKLRGLGLGGITRFAVAEPLLLIALAAPLGLALGVGLTALAARAFLAPGVDVRVSGVALLVGLAALLGAAAAAFLGARATVTASIVTLLRRVPRRGHRRAVIVEGAVAALALAALYEVLVAGDRSTPVAYAAPAFLSLLTGLVVARLLGLWARWRLRSAGDRGRLATLLAAAQVGRRPASERLVAVLTVAVALLAFAATIWDVGAVNRLQAAESLLGADRIYSVAAASPGALLAAVKQVDPAGHDAMAVIRSGQTYNDAFVDLVGVDASRLAAVGRWPGRSAAETRAVAEKIAPPQSATVNLRGARLAVRATVDKLVQTATRPMGLAVLVSEPAEAPRIVDLGRLRTGAATYAGDLACPGGCRLLGVSIRRFPGDDSAGAVTARIAGFAVDGKAVDVPLESQAWRRQASPPVGQTLDLSTNGAGLTLTLTSETSSDVVAQYADTAATAPVVVAGGSPAEDPNADAFSFPVLGSSPDEITVVDRAAAVPGGGDHALLFDGASLVARAEQGSGLTTDSIHYQVWATAAAPADLPARLAAAGLAVTQTQTLATTLQRMGRQSPALALRLYLFAGIVALLLALGALLLDAVVSAPWWRGQARALRMTGVPGRVLRGAVTREQLMLLGFPLVAGLVAGIGGAALVLPAIALVSVGDTTGQVYRLGGGWLPGSVAFLVVALVATVAVLRRLRSPRAEEGR